MSYDPFGGPLPVCAEYHLVWDKGVMKVFPTDADREAGVAMASPPDLREFLNDFLAIMSIAATPEVKTFAYKRLSLLETRFALHRHMNEDEEVASHTTWVSLTQEVTSTTVY